MGDVGLIPDMNTALIVKVEFHVKYILVFFIGVSQYMVVFICNILFVPPLTLTDYFSEDTTQ